MQVTLGFCYFPIYQYMPTKDPWDEPEKNNKPKKYFIAKSHVYKPEICLCFVWGLAAANQFTQVSMTCEAIKIKHLPA